MSSRVAIRVPLRPLATPLTTPVAVFVAAVLMATTALTAGAAVLAPPSSAATSDAKVRKAKRVAMKQVGDRYRYGAEGPHRFDCSGLVHYAFRKAGYDRIPRTSSAQAGHARRIKKSNLRRGDLMFFHDSGGVYHVAIFVGWRDGRRRMVHAPYGGKRVHVAAPWTSRWYAGTLRRR